eukprot:6202623-Pleurochrysis_carterae.AAC.1
MQTEDSIGFRGTYPRILVYANIKRWATQNRQALLSRISSKFGYALNVYDLSDAVAEKAPLRQRCAGGKGIAVI